MARGQVAGKAEAEHRQEIHERRHQRHDHHERKTLLIKVDALTRPEDQELDRRKNEQVGGEGDQSPAMPLAKLPGDCGSGREHDLCVRGWRRGRPDMGDENLIEGGDAFGDDARAAVQAVDSGVQLA